MEQRLKGSAAYLSGQLPANLNAVHTPASPKPTHCVVRSKMMDGTVERGILKYRSIIARISVAYAELDPDVKITLFISWIYPYDLYSLPDKYGLLDTEFPGIQLEAHEPRSSLYHPLIRQQMTERICD